MQEGEEGLRVGGFLRGRWPAAQGRGQAAPVEAHAVGRRQAQKVEDGRREVDPACHHGKSRSGRDTPAPEQQGHAQRALVDEEAMCALLVLPQALAVIRGHDEKSVLAQAEPSEGLVEAAHQAVGPRHLAVVGPTRVLRGIGLGGIVGIVGIVEVQPEEEPARRPRLEPGDRLRQGLVPPFLDAVQEARIVAGSVRETVGVDVEAAMEARLRGEDHRGDEGARREAAALEDGSQGGDSRGERGRDVVADGAAPGVEAREQRDVGGPGEGNLDHGLGNEGTLARHPIEGGGRRVAAAVAAEPVGAQGVDGDENEMAWGRGPRWRAGAAGERQQQGPNLVGPQTLTTRRAAHYSPLNIPSSSLRYVSRSIGATLCVEAL